MHAQSLAVADRGTKKLPSAIALHKKKNNTVFIEQEDLEPDPDSLRKCDELNETPLKDLWQKLIDLKIFPHRKAGIVGSAVWV